MKQTKKEKNFHKFKNEFDKGQLSREKLLRIPSEQAEVYLRKQLQKIQ